MTTDLWPRSSASLLKRASAAGLQRWSPWSCTWSGSAGEALLREGVRVACMAVTRSIECRNDNYSYLMRKSLVHNPATSIVIAGDRRNIQKNEHLPIVQLRFHDVLYLKSS